jgi:hypothetical protein
MDKIVGLLEKILNITSSADRQATKQATGVEDVARRLSPRRSVPTMDMLQENLENLNCW